jgi:nicotinamidase-related amidase
LLEVIQNAAPAAYEKRVKRQGIVNAWDDNNFAQAVRNTGKKHLIVAGVTTDVCLVPPALSMQKEGFHIKVDGRGLLGAQSNLHHTVRP